MPTSMNHVIASVQPRHPLLRMPHFAILTFGAIYIPGDERSRMNPGHGYPESTETTTTYLAYQDRNVWEAEIRRLAARTPPEPFHAFQVSPASVTTEIKVTTDIKVEGG